MSLTKRQYDIIIKSVRVQRDNNANSLTICLASKYMEDFPQIINIRKKEVQELNELIILLTTLRNSKDGAH